MPRARLIRSIAYALLGANVIAISWLWLGDQEVPRTLHAWLIAIGEISSFYLTFCLLIEFLFMGRLPWFEQAWGMERLTKFHRLNGYLVFYFLLAHFFFTTLGYQLARGASFFGQIAFFSRYFDDVFDALLGSACLVILTGASIVAARKYLSHEWWYAIHLTAYLAIILTFQHQINTGPTFIIHPWLGTYWWALYLAVGALFGWFRFGRPLWLFGRHRFVIAEVHRETARSVSLIITGRDINRFHFEAGQFAILHVLTWSRFIQGHPFSFSAAPNGEYLRVTIKTVGDYTGRIHEVEPGTPVIIDGPYGHLTGQYRQRGKLAFIAGGVGITPLYALIQHYAPQGADIRLVYANRTSDDVIFKDELEWFTKQYPNLRIEYLYSNEPGQPKQYATGEALAAAVPDLLGRDVYLCGPPAMMRAVEQSLASLGVPPEQVHAEHFSFFVEEQTPVAADASKST